MTAELIARLRARADRAAMYAGKRGAWVVLASKQEAEDHAGLEALGAGHWANLALDLREAADTLARGCETCKHQLPVEKYDEETFCGMYTGGVDDCYLPYACSELGNVCGRWEAK